MNDAASARSSGDLPSLGVSLGWTALWLLGAGLWLLGATLCYQSARASQLRQELLSRPLTPLGGSALGAELRVEGRLLHASSEPLHTSLLGVTGCLASWTEVKGVEEVTKRNSDGSTSTTYESTDLDSPKRSPAWLRVAATGGELWIAAESWQTLRGGASRSYDEKPAFIKDPGLFDSYELREVTFRPDAAVFVAGRVAEPPAPALAEASSAPALAEASSAPSPSALGTLVEGGPVGVAADERLGGVALFPGSGAEAALAEAEGVLGLLIASVLFGFFGVVFGIVAAGPWLLRYFKKR